MAKSQEGMKPCFGCGAHVPDTDAPVHRYLGASPGCWAIHGEVLARRYGDSRFGDPRLLITNSYMVQHPGMPSPQTIQSVAVHLIGLYAALECNVADGRLIDVLRGAADGSDRFRWLAPPPNDYPVTIVDYYAADDPAVACALSGTMAETTWAAWADHQPQIRRWADELRLV